MTAIDTNKVIGVVGAGTMGAEIAQLAAAAGHPVLLFDAFDGAADKGRARIGARLEKLVSRGKMTSDKVASLTSRIKVAKCLSEMRNAAIVVEAIVENHDIKRTLFADLGGVLAPDAIIGTNTSSISITSMARDLKHPDRVVGMHFFNPAPVMKLVEVISGVATSKAAAETVFATAENWGKIAVHAKSTPGFIVNRGTRAYYAEALRLCEEQVANPATLDALLTQGAGFRIGPFTLMDLIGNDVNYTVCKSVFDAYYQEPRFRPSIVQLELVNVGRFGRKSGRGFYDYSDDAEKPEPDGEICSNDAVLIDGFAPGIATEVDGVAIVSTDGRRAAQVARDLGKPAIVFDHIELGAKRIGFAVTPDVPAAVVDRFLGSLRAQDIVATRLADWPGLVVMRTIAMLANEGFEAVLQGVSNDAGVDAALRYGVNYPKGPIGWAREIGLNRLLATLDNICAVTGDPRYRASMAIRVEAEV